jgi:predicted dienelactone hydrolase
MDSKQSLWPKPRGPHLVGFAQFAITDESRVAPHAPQPTSQRDLVVMAWYPALNVSGCTRRRYMDERDISSAGHPSLNLCQVAPQDQAPLAQLETASYENAPIAAGPFPLIIYCHGLTAFAQMNSVLMEHLASNGYIVLSVAHPFESGTHFHPDGRLMEMDSRIMPDIAKMAAVPKHLDAFFGPNLATRREATSSLISWLRSTSLTRLVHNWADDLIHVVDRIVQGNVPAAAKAISAVADMDRMGYLGMSFGGHVAALCCQKDPRAIAGANLDGGVFTAEPLGREIGVPFLAFTGDMSAGAAALGRTVDPPHPTGLTHLDVAYQRKDGVEPEWPLHRLGVRGTSHLDFADFPILFNAMKATALASTMPVERWLELKVRVVGDFFNRYLRGETTDFPGNLPAEFSDLLVVHQRQVPR